MSKGTATPQAFTLFPGQRWQASQARRTACAQDLSPNPNPQTSELFYVELL